MSIVGGVAAIDALVSRMSRTSSRTSVYVLSLPACMTRWFKMSMCLAPFETSAAFKGSVPELVTYFWMSLYMSGLREPAYGVNVNRHAFQSAIVP